MACRRVFPIVVNVGFITDKFLYHKTGTVGGIPLYKAYVNALTLYFGCNESAKLIFSYRRYPGGSVTESAYTHGSIAFSTRYLKIE